MIKCALGKDSFIDSHGQTEAQPKAPNTFVTTPPKERAAAEVAPKAAEVAPKGFDPTPPEERAAAEEAPKGFVPTPPAAQAAPKAQRPVDRNLNSEFRAAAEEEATSNFVAKSPEARAAAPKRFVSTPPKERAAAEEAAPDTRDQEVLIDSTNHQSSQKGMGL